MPKIFTQKSVQQTEEHRVRILPHEHAIKLPPLTKATELAPEEKMVKIIEQTFEDGAKEQTEGQLAVDVYHTAEDIVVVSPIAGVTKEDIVLSITDDVLSIRGKRQTHEFVPEENYLTRECFFGPFSRTIILPENVDTTKMKASFQHSILTIIIPKAERVKTRVIPIQT